MSHPPAATPPATGPRRPWRTSRRALAYVAGAAAVATALVVQACADGGPTGTAPTPPPNAAAGPGALETARIPSGKIDVAWVGALHNRGLDAVLARARTARPEDRATSKARCALIGRLTSQFLQAERTRDPNLRTLATGKLSNAQLAQLAREAACTADLGIKMRLGDAVGSAGSEGRLELEGDGNPSPAAVALLNQIDDVIRWMSSAQGLSQNLVPIEQRAELLPDASERILVLETATTARASAYYQQENCQAPGSCGGGDRPPDDTRAGVNSDVVRADAWGCIWGGIRGVVAGPSGVFAGCLWGGLGSSGGIIFRHLTT